MGTIQKFLLDKIPSKSYHRLLSMDAQPIAAAFTGGQTTILVQVAGSVQYQNLFNKTSFLPHKGITGKLRLIRLDIKNIPLKPIDCLAILSINVISQNKYLQDIITKIYHLSCYCLDFSTNNLELVMGLF